MMRYLCPTFICALFFISFNTNAHANYKKNQCFKKLYKSEFTKSLKKIKKEYQENLEIESYLVDVQYFYLDKRFKNISYNICFNKKDQTTLQTCPRAPPTILM